MSKHHPVVFEAFDAERHLTVKEARALLFRIRVAMDKLKTKCPTCRCRIIQGEACDCCADAEPDYTPECFI